MAKIALTLLHMVFVHMVFFSVLFLQHAHGRHWHILGVLIFVLQFTQKKPRNKQKCNISIREKKAVFIFNLYAVFGSNLTCFDIWCWDLWFHQINVNVGLRKCRSCQIVHAILVCIFLRGSETLTLLQDLSVFPPHLPRFLQRLLLAFYGSGGNIQTLK